MRSLPLFASGAVSVLMCATVSAEDLPGWEVYMQQINVGTGTVTWTMTGVGTRMWDAQFCETSDGDLWNADAIEVTGLDTAFSNGWNFVTGAGFGPRLGAGLYRLTNTYETGVVYFVDFRDDSLMVTGGPGVDIVIRYDGSGPLSARGANQNPFPAWTTFSSGDTIRVWKLKRGSSAQADTTKFQPTTPTNLTLTNSGGHPKLTWQRSEPRSCSMYKVYRNNTQITPSPISDTTYTDTQVQIGGGSTISYKVRAVNGSMESANFSTTVSTSGVFEDRPADLANVAHRRYRLDTSYPNPFNPSTTLRYTLPDRSKVTLLVFNTLGQKVATLVEGEVDAGSHEATFDAGGLPSGLYLARLIAGGTVQTTRMQLVR